MALRASQAVAQPRPSVTFRAAAAGAGRAAVATPPRLVVPVRYLGAAPIVVRGTVTGHAYQFAAGRSIQPVDARDVAGLLKKGIFRRNT
jgi:hypothetical protein